MESVNVNEWVQQLLRNLGRGQQVTLRTWTRGHLKGDFRLLVSEVHVDAGQVCLSDNDGLYIYEFIEKDEEGVFVVPRCDCEGGTTAYKFIV